MSGELEAAKKAPLRQVPSVKLLLINDNAREQLSMVAAKHMNPERMMRVVANAIRTTPKLGECDPISFLGALMQCAALGLEPNTVLGHAYLVPFNKRQKNPKTGEWEDAKTPEVQVIIGYKGLIDLARRSGHITSISANIHYSDDDLWEYEEGTEAKLRHRPGPQEGEKLHAYAIAQFREGGHAYVVLPWKAVMKIRDGSQNWQTAVKTKKTDKAPWKTHEDAMAMKTAIRALAKYLPLSVEFADAMAIDERKADYRRFAMDPTQGMPIEGETIDGEAFDAETGEVATKEEAKRIEKDEPVTTDVKPKAEKKTAPVEQSEGTARETANKAAPAPAAPEAEQAGLDLEEPAEDPAIKWQSKLRLMRADLETSGEDAVLDLWADELERLRDEAQHLHTALMADMAAHTAAQG